MIKTLGMIIGFTIIFCTCVDNHAQKKLKQEYSSGSKSGYEYGYSEMEPIFQKKLEEHALAFQKSITNQRKIYEKKISAAHQDGFDKGKKDKQQDVESTLEKVASTKEKKGKWNDVLFDVNN